MIDASRCVARTSQRHVTFCAHSPFARTSLPRVATMSSPTRKPTVLKTSDLERMKQVRWPPQLPDNAPHFTSH